MKFDLCTIDWMAISAIATMLMVFATFIALILNWYQQRNIQKKNIKVQLFEKRYAVFSVINNARVLILREDIALMVITGIMKSDELHKKIYDNDEKIRDAASLSQMLFDKMLFDKMNEISKKHYAVFLASMKLLTGNLSSIKLTDAQKESYDNILKNTAIDEQKRLDEIKKIIPGMGDAVLEWHKVVSDFNNYFITCGIGRDFNNYLKIKDLDK